MMVRQPLIKCECEKCNCVNATAADFGVCYECSSGLHATSKWKDGVKVRKMNEGGMNLTLKVKLASIIVHLEEMLSETGHVFDKRTLESLLEDREIRQFIESIDPAMLPVKR